jgi:hypothetical protein
MDDQRRSAGPKHAGVEQRKLSISDQIAYRQIFSKHAGSAPILFGQAAFPESTAGYSVLQKAVSAPISSPAESNFLQTNSILGRGLQERRPARRRGSSLCRSSDLPADPGAMRIKPDGERMACFSRNERLTHR